MQQEFALEVLAAQANKVEHLNRYIEGGRKMDRNTRIFNLPRAAGKSMRMVYASEFHKIPILCPDNTAKEYLLFLSGKFGIEIPEPITVDKLDEYKEKNQGKKDILIDEPLIVLEELLKRKSRAFNIIGCAFSDGENSKICRWYESSGYIDKTDEERMAEIDREIEEDKKKNNEI